jgi:hypothetical protein
MSWAVAKLGQIKVVLATRTRSAPGRRRHGHVGIVPRACMTPSTFDGRTSQSPRAPRSWWQLAQSSWAVPASTATRASWPQACMAPSTWKRTAVSSHRGSASMSPRSTVVGPGLSPSTAAVSEVVPVPTDASRWRSSISSRTTTWVKGSSSPSSRWDVETAERDALSSPLSESREGPSPPEASNGPRQHSGWIRWME